MDTIGLKDSRDFQRYISLSKDETKITKDFIQKNNIKRGLRNEDGTGVVAGATKVSSVQGYKVVDDKKIPLEGKLLYRGIDLNQLIDGAKREDRASFEEIVYLLLFGSLPTEVDLEQFSGTLQDLRNLPTHFLEDVIFTNPSQDIMNMLQREILTLYTYDETADATELKEMLFKIISLIAKFPLLVSYTYMANRHYFQDKSLVIHNLKEGMGTAETILCLIRNEQDYTKDELRLLDLCLSVHAEHGGGNNSAFASSVVSSSGTDYYSSIATAIGSLKGPKHGGASLKVTEMIQNIKDHVGDWSDEGALESYLRQILNQEAFDKSGLIYGIGHAVYTKSDPRAELLKKEGRKVAKQKGRLDEFKLVERIEEIGIKLLKEKKGKDYEVCANIDLYSGLVYSLLELNKELFTPIFACARVVGWSAHILEQIRDGKIIRPAYVTMASKNKYIPIADR